MGLLIDTHILAWFVAGDRRLPHHVRTHLIESGQPLLVSAVTAWEYADLQNRGRLPEAASFSFVASILNFDLLDLPAILWELAINLPDLHRDPVDRMLIAHAIHADLTLVTGDATMRQYPVRTIW